MTDLIPTPEQSTIVSAARDTTDNLLIKALAGAAKTSTLVLIAKAQPQVSTLCLAFNKKIALEMQDRLPGNCTAKTLNSVGHTAWGEFIRRRPQVDTGKTYRILKSLIDELTDAEQKLVYENFNDILRAIDSGKTAGYIPDGAFPHAKPLMGDDDFNAWLDDEPTNLEWDLIRATSIKSLQEAHKGIIDFNDQILCSALFPCSFPQFPLVLIDEAQDLSALNHVMLHKLAKKRLIAVGDPCQAIYGFRGAHESSMDLLQEQFHMKELTLSISFRCPTAIVQAAQWRAPHMKWPEWAKPGEVRKLTEWGVDTLPPSAAIICRNNSPLFGMAIKLLKNGRYPELVGNDIGKMLLKWMKKLGPETMKQPEVFKAIEKWQVEKLKKSRAPTKVMDQADCLRIFAERGDTLGRAIAYAETIFNSTGPIKLMTGHKSKGLEFDDVFFLDEELIGDEGQELNLKYVIITRAKSTLTYIQSTGFTSDLDE